MPDEFGFNWSTAADCIRVKEELVRDYFLKQADSYKAAIAKGEHFENENLFREALSSLPEVRSPEVQSSKLQSPKLQKMTFGTSSLGVEIPEEAEELIDKPVDETTVKSPEFICRFNSCFVHRFVNKFFGVLSNFDSQERGSNCHFLKFRRLKFRRLNFRRLNFWQGTKSLMKKVFILEMFPLAIAAL
ncbi:hypothetical protein LXL04_037804 [Taraxacum kok-saghyz]